MSVFSFLLILAALSGIGAWFRHHAKVQECRHRERMAAIDRGLPPAEDRTWAGVACLGIGALVPMTCLILSIVVLANADGIAEAVGDNDAIPILLLALFAAGGMSLVIGSALTYALFRPGRSAPRGSGKPEFTYDPMGAEPFDVPKPAPGR